jgi:hypothetical protein
MLLASSVISDSISNSLVIPGCGSWRRPRFVVMVRDGASRLLTMRPLLEGNLILRSAPLRASRRMGHTRLLVLAARCARGLQSRPPPKREGAGNAGCPMHPWPQKKAVVFHRFTGLNRHSLHNGFTVSFVLSPVTGLCCHRHRADTSARLERQQRGVRTTRLRRPQVCAVRRHAQACVHRFPHPTSVTIAIRPSCGRGIT